MGQLESLRELSISKLDKKRKNNNNIIMLWLFHLIGIPMNFEVLNLAH
jgi:hypothetical protein